MEEDEEPLSEYSKGVLILFGTLIVLSTVTTGMMIYAIIVRCMSAGTGG